MKKDRNSFFSQYGMESFNSGMNNMPFPYQNNYNYNNELESRINKLEREISRLDARISKLETVNPTSNSTDYNFANSMYMV